MKITTLIIYMDDIVVIGNDGFGVARLKGSLAQEFEIKNLGFLTYFIGIEVVKAKQDIFFSQRKYVLDVLKESDMEGCKPCATPIKANHRLKEDDSERLIDAERFQRLMGHLIYLSLTHLDITHAVSVISQFMHAPIQDHMKAAYWVLRYLKGCLGKSLLYKRHGHQRVEVYTNADWVRSLTDRRFTFGYCSFVGDNLVTWRSKKQSVVARSSAVTEFTSMAHGI